MFGHTKQGELKFKSLLLRQQKVLVLQGLFCFLRVKTPYKSHTAPQKSHKKRFCHAKHAKKLRAFSFGKR